MPSISGTYITFGRCNCRKRKICKLKIIGVIFCISGSWLRRPCETSWVRRTYTRFSAIERASQDPCRWQTHPESIEWFIEYQAFFRMIRLLGIIPSPSLPSASFLSFAVFLCVAGLAYWHQRGRGWARSQIIRRQESLVLYKSFVTLCRAPTIFCTASTVAIRLSSNSISVVRKHLVMKFFSYRFYKRREACTIFKTRSLATIGKKLIW